MAGGRQTFKKRQKEQQRKERQEEKFAKRMQRKREPAAATSDVTPSDGTPEEQAQVVNEGDRA